MSTDQISPEKPKKTQLPAETKVRSFKPSQVINKKRTLYEFEGKWLASFGKPEQIAKWYITGPPYSGKSSFLFMLCQMLCQFGKVNYNSYEEGNSATVADKMQMTGLDQRDDLFRLVEKAPVPLFLKHMLKKGSAQFAVIDSIQHADMNKHLYWEFTRKMERRGKSLLFISHWIKNDYTLFVKHDCDIKIEVIGFVAHIQSRYGGNKPFVIWEERAKQYWGKKYNLVINGRYWPGQKK